MKSKTLLQKALAVPTQEAPKMTKEEIQLALAWVKGKVTNRQIQKVITGKKTGGAAVYVFLAHALKAHINK